MPTTDLHSEPPGSEPIAADVREFNAADTSLLTEVARLRVRAWRAYERLPAFQAMDMWLDTYDEEARHWACFVDASLVGAARLTVHPRIGDAPEHSSWGHLVREGRTPIGMLSRLVVAPEARGRRLSGALDRARLIAARECGVRDLLVVTYTRRAASLARLGFEEMGRFEYREGPLVEDKDNVLLRLAVE